MNPCPHDPNTTWSLKRAMSGQQTLFCNACDDWVRMPEGHSITGQFIQMYLGLGKERPPPRPAGKQSEVDKLAHECWELQEILDGSTDEVLLSYHPHRVARSADPWRSFLGFDAIKRHNFKSGINEEMALLELRDSLRAKIQKTLDEEEKKLAEQQERVTRMRQQAPKPKSITILDEAKNETKGTSNE